MDLLTKRISLFSYIISATTGQADDEPVSNGLAIEPFDVGGINLSSALTWIFFLTSTLNDMILLYRCYRLWNASKKVIILPALVLVVAPTLFALTGLNQSQEEAGLSFTIYVFSEIGVGLGLTILLASRIWWLNRQTERYLGKSSQSTLRKLMEIVIESGILLPVFLGLALGLVNIGTNHLNLVPSGPQILSVCALTQVAAIASTLIIVRIGLGVDVQPSQFTEGTHRPDMAHNDSLALDLELAPISDVDNSNPAIINPFLLKYQDPPSGLAPPMPAEQGDATIWPFTLKYRTPSLTEPGHIIDRLIHPFSQKYDSIPSNTRGQAPSKMAAARPVER